jgi:VWFA-related protein
MQGDIEGARKSFERGITVDAKNIHCYLPYAALESQHGHWPLVAELTERLIQLDPVDYPRAYLLCAAAHYNAKDFARAELNARQAQRLDTQAKIPEIERLLGLILVRKGEAAAGAAQLREYLRLVPGAADAERTRALLTQLGQAGETLSLDSEASFQANAELALVSFQLTHNRQSLISELRREDVEIREDGVPQKLAILEGGRLAPRTVPVEITLLFDCSSSVRKARVLDPNIFRVNFLDENENVALRIYGFSNQLVRFGKATRDPDILKRAMDKLFDVPPRNTPLFGSIAATIRDAASGGGNAVRMMVVFSDGESAYRGDALRGPEAVNAALETGTAIYPALLLTGGLARAKESVSVQKFLELAERTGGRSFSGPMDDRIVPSILQSMAAEIQSSYVAGYYPRASDAKSQHVVQVGLTNKERGEINGGMRILVH